MFVLDVIGGLVLAVIFGVGVYNTFIWLFAERNTNNIVDQSNSAAGGDIIGRDKN